MWLLPRYCMLDTAVLWVSSDSRWVVFYCVSRIGLLLLGWCQLTDAVAWVHSYCALTFVIYCSVWCKRNIASFCRALCCWSMTVAQISWYDCLALFFPLYKSSCNVNCDYSCVDYCPLCFVQTLLYGVPATVPCISTGVYIRLYASCEILINGEWRTNQQFLQITYI